MTLRALDNIQSYGQPSSQPFLPSTVFAQHNLDIAGNIFAISTLLLSVTLLWPHRVVATRASKFPAPSRRVLVLLGAFICGMAVSSETILTRNYTNQGGFIFGLNFGGLNALIFGLAFYEMARRTLSGIWRPLTGFVVLADHPTHHQLQQGFHGIRHRIWAERGDVLADRATSACSALADLLGSSGLDRSHRLCHPGRSRRLR